MSKIIFTTAAIIAMFNPANAADLSDDQKDHLQHLSKEDINALAQAYPNTAQSNNYLLLLDKRLPADKQLFQLSSWKNLKDLHDYGQNHFVAYGFRGQQEARQPVPTIQSPANSTVDLSEQDVANAEGLKKDDVNVIGTPAQGLNSGLQNLQVSNDPTLHGDILAPVGNINDGAKVNSEVDVNSQGAGESDIKDVKIDPVFNAELVELEVKLEQLKKDGAHHMSIRAVERQIADLKGE